MRLFHALTAPLLLLQLLRRIGAGGLEGLAEDGEERNDEGDERPGGEDPSVAVDPVPELA